MTIKTFQCAILIEMNFENRFNLIIAVLRFAAEEVYYYYFVLVNGVLLYNNFNLEV